MESKGESEVVQCGREISGEEIAQIQETVATFWRLSRIELVETICEHMGWRTASGTNKVDACAKLLEKLESQGLLKLPEKRGLCTGKVRELAITERTAPAPEIVGSIKEAGGVGLKIVIDKEESALWKEYVNRYHYLKYKRPHGCYVRYFIESGRGRLGCLLFAGAAQSIGVRDRWIGWSSRERLLNLGYIVNNTRFLIFPWVKVRNLASHVLGAAGRRIRDDWEERWNYRPVLLETFVDPQYYVGSSYLAANWLYLGMTTGEGLVRPGKNYTTTPKKIFVFPLVEDIHTALCQGIRS